MRVKKTQEQYVNDVYTKHGDKITVIGEYISANSPIKLKCNVCECEWSCESKQIIAGHGCPDCGHKKNRLSRVKTHNKFVEDVFKKHKDRLTIIGEYYNSNTRILTKCNMCNHEWEPISNGLIKGRGCPICKVSKGETLINEILTELKINFIQHYVINDIKSIDNGRLEYDFYFEHDGLKIMIEYDGEQHFKPVKKWGGTKRFEQQQRIDLFKNEYCKNNHIKLIRIPYTDLNKINKTYLENLINTN